MSEEKLTRAAVVTGGSRGIGKAVCLELARGGANVVLCYAGRAEAAQETVTACEDLGAKALAVQCNVADEAQVKALMDAAVKEFGRIDILVNNAGISAREPLADYSPEAFRSIMDLNVTAVFHGCKAVEPIMRAAGKGCIINTSSMVSLYGQPGGVGYPASKFAVNGLTRSLARELGRAGIRVNAVAPGVTRTDMVAALPQELVDRISAPIPLGRIGEPQEVANAYLFLASDLASYVTGEILSVDGAAQT
mgnify:CR=1 FL=1